MVGDDQRLDDEPAVRALAWLANGFALRCTPSHNAFSVGAVIAAPNGRVLGSGFSRETGPSDHAEEAALAAARASGQNLDGAYAFVSLEPCGHRKSKPAPCAKLLIEAGIARVYFTSREPPLFVAQNGLDLLRSAGVECIEVTGFEDLFERANAHLFREIRRTIEA